MCSLNLRIVPPRIQFYCGLTEDPAAHLFLDSSKSMAHVLLMMVKAVSTRTHTHGMFVQTLFTSKALLVLDFQPPMLKTTRLMTIRVQLRTLLLYLSSSRNSQNSNRMSSISLVKVMVVSTFLSYHGELTNITSNSQTPMITLTLKDTLLEMEPLTGIMTAGLHSQKLLTTSMLSLKKPLTSTNKTTVCSILTVSNHHLEVRLVKRTGMKSTNLLKI